MTDYHWKLEDIFNVIVNNNGEVDLVREIPGQVNLSGIPVDDPAYILMVIGKKGLNSY